MYDYILDNDMSAYTSTRPASSTVTAVDPTHGRMIVHQKPKADMLLALNSIPILPEHIWKDVSPKLAGTTYPNKPPIVGSGAFQCVEYKKSSYVIMEANKEYWRGAPHIDQLIFQCYTNEDTLAQDLKARHARRRHPAAQLADPALQGRPERHASSPSASTATTTWCSTATCRPRACKSLGNPALQDAKFRQALQYAVDREKIVSIVYYGNARPADTIITADYYTDPDWHWTPPADQAYTFDLAKADELLTAAGYPLEDGVRVDKDGKPITLRLWSRQSSARASRRARCWPGRSASSASRSTTRSWTTAPSWTSSTT